jgi:3'-phosphoadenosine 5'-phosphosulfate sulfotransferase (PAPS reductase)/FAD synthetase
MIENYKNPALQFSGGKDSLACLYLLKDNLDAITVYWCDTGDACEETVKVINKVREWIPHFKVVKTDSTKWRKENGIPSDLVPVSGHLLGVAYGMSETRISNKFDCCFENLMRPMHEAMLADGIDLVIRGTKIADTGKIPAEGKTPFYDIWLPIKDWTHDEVFIYLEKVGAPKNAIYDYFRGISAPECLTCTAWWDDGKKEFLRNRHPEQYLAYKQNLRKIANCVYKHLSQMEEELNEDLVVMEINHG